MFTEWSLTVLLLKPILTASLAISTFAISTAVTAQFVSDYPNRPISLVVPVPPGGAADFVARTVAEALGKELGQPITVENKAGASGALASSYVAKSKPDGYTLLQNSITTHGIGPYFMKNLNYDPQKDLVPVGGLAEFSLIMVVNSELKVNTISDLIALSKQRPVSFASSGKGGAPHLSGELFGTATKSQTLHVPYKGSGPAAVDVAAGRVDVMFDAAPSLLPHIKSGKVKPVAAVGNQRNSLLPDVPTSTELGYPQMVASLWYGVMAPAGTPEAIIDKLNKALNQVLANPEMKAKLAERGAVVMLGSPQEYAKFINNDYARWGQVIKQAGVSTDE